MSCRGITRQSAVLYRLLTQTIEAPKKSDKHIKRKKWKRTIESKKEKAAVPLCGSSPVWASHSSWYPFTIPLCIRTRVMLPSMWLNCLCHKLKTPTDPKGGLFQDPIFIRHSILLYMYYRIPSKDHTNYRLSKSKTLTPRPAHCTQLHLVYQLEIQLLL